MPLCIDHETRLTYSEPVTESVMEIRMAPHSNEDQTVLGYRLRITPPAAVTTYRDGFGNRVDLFNVLPPHAEVVIRATSYVRVHRHSLAERRMEVPWPVDTAVNIETAEFLHPTPLVDECAALTAFRSALPSTSGKFVERVERVMAAIRRHLKYEKRVTTARTPVSEVLALGRGVCQDFAHLFLGVCRGLGLPARYVSGYVNQPGEVETHAWCQVWGGSAVGWVDVDPTNGTWAAADHVVTAVGRDYADVPPNRGAWKGRARETMTVQVKVQPVERIPLEWSEMNLMPQIPRPLMTFSRQMQRQAMSNGLKYQAQAHGPLRQQQSQQQQGT